MLTTSNASTVITIVSNICMRLLLINKLVKIATLIGQSYDMGISADFECRLNVFQHDLL
jgi:hypothetical protein